MSGLLDYERQLLEDIAIKSFTRDDVASSYAMALRSDDADRVDWSKVNRRIVDRWSVSALKYIKTEAWRMAGRRSS